MVTQDQIKNPTRIKTSDEIKAKIIKKRSLFLCTKSLNNCPPSRGSIGIRLIIFRKRKREYHSKIRLLDTNKLNSIVYYKKAIYYKRVKNYKISNHLFFKTILNSKNINLILKSFYNILF